MARLASFDARSSLSTDYLRPSGLDEYGNDKPFDFDRQNYTAPSAADVLAADVFACLGRGTTTEELLSKLTSATDETLAAFLTKVQSIAFLNSSDAAAKQAFDWLLATTKAVIDSRKPLSTADLLTKQILDKLQTGTTLDELVGILSPATDEALRGMTQNVERLSANLTDTEADRQAKDLLEWLTATARAIIDSRKSR